MDFVSVNPKDVIQHSAIDGILLWFIEPVAIEFAVEITDVVQRALDVLKTLCVTDGIQLCRCVRSCEPRETDQRWSASILMDLVVRKGEFEASGIPSRIERGVPRPKNKTGIDHDAGAVICNPVIANGGFNRS